MAAQHPLHLSPPPQPHHQQPDDNRCSDFSTVNFSTVNFISLAEASALVIVIVMAPPQLLRVAAASAGPLKASFKAEA